MSTQILACKALPENRLWLCFHDQRIGIVNMSGLMELTVGDFHRLRDQREFSAAYVDRGGMAIAWPCGIALDADVLRAGSAPAGQYKGTCDAEFQRFMAACTRVHRRRK